MSQPFRRRSVVTVAALLVIATACSSGSGASESGTTATVANSTTTTTTTSGVAPTAASFTIPDSRYDAVAAAGLTFNELTYPSQPDGVPWPTVDWPLGDLPGDVDGGAVDALVAKAFGELSDDAGQIDAVLVVQGGKLVVEEYNDWDPTATHNSWSVAKSINSALVGILVGEGRIDPWAPVAAPEWSDSGDPRAAITLDELLRMSSGLQWDESYTDPNGDVLVSLGPDNDRANFTASKPLESEPGSTWEYSSGTANLIARSVAEQVGYGDALTSWIDTALFEPLGITSVEHLVDRAGVISGGSWINLTPRDFARFGLLYARNGIWDGTRLLPDGWVDYSRMPTPTDPEGTYGAQWWLQPSRPGSFYASGFSGQSITVVPERDLVVVVLSDVSDDRDEQLRQGLLDQFGA